MTFKKYMFMRSEEIEEAFNNIEMIEHLSN